MNYFALLCCCLVGWILGKMCGMEKIGVSCGKGNIQKPREDTVLVELYFFIKGNFVPSDPWLLLLSLQVGNSYWQLVCGGCG